MNRNRIFIIMLVLGLMAAWSLGVSDALAGGKKSQDQQNQQSSGSDRSMTNSASSPDASGATGRLKQ